MGYNGRDYIGGGMMTIIGASGEIISGDDAAADMILHRISGWPDDAIIGQATVLRAMAPNIAQRAQFTNPRVASLLTRAPMMIPRLQSQLTPPGVPGPHVVESSPGPVGLALVPMNSAGNVAAGASATITVQPQSIFKPYRLTVDPVIAAFFMISTLQVGTVPLFDAPGEVAASNFPPNLQQGNLKKITANPGISITMVVRNRDGVAHPYFSSMFGEAAPTQCG